MRVVTIIGCYKETSYNQQLADFLKRGLFPEFAGIRGRYDIRERADQIFIILLFYCPAGNEKPIPVRSGLSYLNGLTQAFFYEAYSGISSPVRHRHLFTFSPFFMLFDIGHASNKPLPMIHAALHWHFIYSRALRRLLPLSRTAQPGIQSGTDIYLKGSLTTVRGEQ